MKFPPAKLEQWMRRYYFDTDIDIGSSGVEPYSLKELRSLLGFGCAELDAVVLQDSQTQGSPALRSAIAERWGRGDSSRVMVTHGSSEAIYLLALSLLEGGDTVVALEPCYQQLYAVAEALGCRILQWRLNPERLFAPDIEEALPLIGPGTRMVVANFPHNPTGVTLKPDEQAALVEASARVGAYLLWDAAFSELTYNSAPLPPPSLTYDRAITIGTLSKAYGLPGLRVGWLIGPPEVIRRCEHVRDYATLHLSPLVEFIAERAVRQAEVLLEPRFVRARRNRELVSSWIGLCGGAVEWLTPEGGVCGFTRFRKLEDTEPLCRELAMHGRVLLVPGSCFGHPSFVRLGFGGPTMNLREGLSRLSAAAGLGTPPGFETP